MESEIPVKVMKEIFATTKDGDVEILNIIVDYSCKAHDTDISWLTISDKKGRSPLHLAATYGHVNIVNFAWKELIASTTSKKLRKQYVDMTDFKGRTALFNASAKGYGEVVYYLINRDINLEVPTNENHVTPGSTALMASAERNTLECFELLMDAGANILAQRKDRADALYLAAKNGNNDIIRFLGVNDYIGPVINRESFHGRTAILTASLNGHLETCKVLLEYGAKLNYQDKDKFTAVIFAANEGHESIVKWLVANGADIYRKDKHGASALATALAQGHNKIVSFLLKVQRIMENGGDLDDLAKLATST